MNIIERIESALEKAKENVFEKHMPPKDSDIDVILVDAIIELKDIQQQIEELHASRESLLEYKSKVESGEFVLVPCEPNGNMLRIASNIVADAVNEPWDYPDIAKNIYEAMIKAVEK